MCFILMRNAYHSITKISSVTCSSKINLEEEKVMLSRLLLTKEREALAME